MIAGRARDQFSIFYFSSIANALDGRDGGACCHQHWDRATQRSSSGVHFTSFLGGGASCGCVHPSLLTTIITKHTSVSCHARLSCLCCTPVSRAPDVPIAVLGGAKRASSDAIVVRQGGGIVASSIGSERAPPSCTARFFEAARCLLRGGIMLLMLTCSTVESGETALAVGGDSKIACNPPLAGSWFQSAPRPS